MNIIKKTIRHEEVGLVFRNGKLARILEPGTHWQVALNQPLEVRVYDRRTAQIASEHLEQLAASDLLLDHCRFIDLGDGERALVWLDGRLASILGPGLHGFWSSPRKLKIEVVEATALILDHPQLQTILGLESAREFLEIVEIPVGMAGILFTNGRFDRLLESGVTAIWKGVSRTQVQTLDLREQVLEVAGQEIMTQDKVSLRLSAVLNFQVVEPRKSVEAVSNLQATLYREVQMVLRVEVGAVTLEQLLAEKEKAASQARRELESKAREFGVRIIGLGIRDVILPGDMKELLNQVIEAQKASEANGIRRREETAAMRSQLNTARLMENNPTLMRLRELEVLEAVARTTNLNVVLGEKGLTDRITKLI